MSRYKFTCYISLEFLESLFQQKPVFDDENISKYQLWLDFYQMLRHHCELLFNCTSDECYNLAKKKNEIGKFITFIIKASQRNCSEVHCTPDVFQQINEDEEFFTDLANPNSIFLFNRESSYCNSIEQDYGYIAINADQVFEKVPFLMNWGHKVLHKDENISSWDFLKSFKHPCNSLIINDSYIFAKGLDRVRENLIEILKAIIPENEMEIDFHLTIITLRDDRTGLPNQDYYAKIMEILNEEIDDHRFDESNFSIIIRKIHNRNILTNYLWINSDHGFTVFENREVVNETPVRINPITCLNNEEIEYNKNNEHSQSNNSVFESYQRLLKEYEKAIASPMLNEFYGKRKNRLVN